MIQNANFQTDLLAYYEVSNMLTESVNKEMAEYRLKGKYRLDDCHVVSVYQQIINRLILNLN